MDWIIGREPVSAWTHGAWMLLWLPATYVLWRLCRGDRAKRAGMLVFGLTSVLCFGFSWLYHSARASPACLDVFGDLDYIGIYLLIAGTATPVALVVLRGLWRSATLATIWALGLTGIVLCLTGVEMPRWLSTGFYLLMGWVGCVTYFEMAKRLSHRALRLLWIGGLFYSVGALVYAFRWPEPWPGVFGHHELFHLFVMAGNLSHYFFMLFAVVPYVAPAPLPALAEEPEPQPALRPAPASS
jgi:hemolysin III